MARSSRTLQVRSIYRVDFYSLHTFQTQSSVSTHYTLVPHKQFTVYSLQFMCLYDNAFYFKINVRLL